MTDSILELADIHLAPEITEDDFLAASRAFQAQFLDHQDGFVRRDMVRKSKGHFVDVILWKSQAHADAVFKRAQTSHVAARYFSHMHFSANADQDGVCFMPVIASFQGKA